MTDKDQPGPAAPQVAQAAPPPESDPLDQFAAILPGWTLDGWTLAEQLLEGLEDAARLVAELAEALNPYEARRRMQQADRLAGEEGKRAEHDRRLQEALRLLDYIYLCRQQNADSLRDLAAVIIHADEHRQEQQEAQRRHRQELSDAVDKACSRLPRPSDNP